MTAEVKIRAETEKSYDFRFEQLESKEKIDCSPQLEFADARRRLWECCIGFYGGRFNWF
jgi:hypothetical protein